MNKPRIEKRHGRWQVVYPNGRVAGYTTLRIALNWVGQWYRRMRYE